MVDRRNKKFFIAGISILSGIVLLCLTLYFGFRSARVKPPSKPAQETVAELVSANGMILVKTPGKSEWREVKAGARFMEGDLIQTDSSGEAAIQYRNGSMVSIPEKTVFTIRRSAENQMEISAPPGSGSLPPVLMAEEGAEESVPQTKGTRPFIELQQIIPFGRSLELVGRVEAGSSLFINDEIVEVAGDGSFKHFTSPFPVSAHLVRIHLKVKDLAGRTRIWTATHDFSPNGGDN